MAREDADVGAGWMSMELGNAWSCLKGNGMEVPWKEEKKGRKCTDPSWLYEITKCLLLLNSSQWQIASGVGAMYGWADDAKDERCGGQR